MKRLLLALALCLLPASAWAQASYTFPDFSTTQQTVRSFNCSSMICPLFVPSDVTGAAVWGPPGTPNGNAMTVQGAPGMTPFLSAQSGSWNVGQTGTWTVQPGNTANTTPWLATISQGGNSATVSAGGALKVDGSAATQPVSAASLPLPTGAATATNQTNVAGPVAAGSAAANSQLAGAVFNTTPPTLTNGQQAAVQVSSRGGLQLGSQYPAGATAITASATGTTAATTATLPTGVSVVTVLCGFSIRANAAAASTADSTVTGTIGGTLHFTQWTAPNTTGIGVTEMIFSPCVPASAVNTAIAVISAAPGTGGVVSVTAWGYTL